MACAANHDSGLPQSRHWCETNFGCSSPLFTHIERVEKFGGGDGPAEGGFGRRRGGGRDAFFFNFNLSNASVVPGHRGGGAEAQNPDQQGP